jgi:hypothetical protein
VAVSKFFSISTLLPKLELFMVLSKILHFVDDLLLQNIIKEVLQLKKVVPQCNCGTTQGSM